MISRQLLLQTAPRQAVPTPTHPLAGYTFLKRIFSAEQQIRHVRTALGSPVRLDTSLTERLPPTLRKLSLYGKVAVVTGGARGLGMDMAKGLAESGLRGLGILDVGEDNGQEAARSITKETGVDTQFYQVDVRDGKAVACSIRKIADHYGGINILLNSAGIADSNIRAEDYELPRFRNVIDINLTGLFITSQAVGREMIARKTGGTIINIASMSGAIVNYPQPQCAYNASKAGVISLTRSLAAEWAKHGIRVNTISPGYMDTDLNKTPELEAKKRVWMANTPQKRLGNIDEIRHIALLLASDGSSFMTGSEIRVDGGYTLW